MQPDQSGSASENMNEQHEQHEEHGPPETFLASSTEVDRDGHQDREARLSDQVDFFQAHSLRPGGFLNFPHGRSAEPSSIQGENSTWNLTRQSLLLTHFGES